MIAWAISITFVPAFITMIPERKLEGFGLTAQKEDRPNWLTRTLSLLGGLTYKRARAVLVTLLVIFVVSIWGLTQINVNDNYAKRFARGHPLREADIALNSHFGGMYMAYLILEGEDSETARPPDIQQIAEDLIRYSDNINHEYPAAPALAKSLRNEIPDIASRNPERGAFLAATLAHIEELAADAPDAEYFAFQELKNFFAMLEEEQKTFKRPDVLEYIAGLQAHMESTELVGKTTSPADVVRKVNQELIDGKPENFRIPDKLPAVSECYMQYQQSHRPDDLWHLVTPDYMQANVRMQFTTGDSKNMNAAVEAVDAYFEEHAPPVRLAHRWAGLHYINSVLEEKLVWGFAKSLAGGFIVIFLMTSFLFRSFRWALLCMVPLTITLLAIYGGTGIIGKDYDLPIAVLSALSIGMAVDFAIHFLERSRSAYHRTQSWIGTVPLVFGEPAPSHQ